MVRSTLCVAAILAIAAGALGCRREVPVPEPRGLGAADIAAKQAVEK